MAEHQAETSMLTLTMNSKTICPWCDVSRAWLDAHGIIYVEVKLDDPADRAAMFDRLGLVGAARTVPQFVLTAEGEDYLISGSKELMQTGLESLFGKLPVTAVIPATSIAVGADAVGVEAIEPTCESCE
jgi:glutaredoxin